MISKLQRNLKYALYTVVLFVALLMDTAVFPALGLQFVPTVMPVAVACIGIWSGAEVGCVFGLVGGLMRAWSGSLTMYGAWCIVILVVIGTGTGIFSDHYLLQSWKTGLAMSAAAVALTDGVYTLLRSFGGTLPADAIISMFLPEGIVSVFFVVIFYPVTQYISRIGGFHG